MYEHVNKLEIERALFFNYFLLAISWFGKWTFMLLVVILMLLSFDDFVIYCKYDWDFNQVKEYEETKLKLRSDKMNEELGYNR